jgi:hypothetical protein
MVSTGGSDLPEFIDNEDANSCVNWKHIVATVCESFQLGNQT